MYTTGTISGSGMLVVQSTNSGWRRQFVNGAIGSFTLDSKQVVLEVNDSLFIFSLGSEKSTFLSIVKTFSQCRNG